MSTELGENDFAIVWSAEEGFHLLVPKMDGDAFVPQEGAFLTALYMRMREDGFVEETMKLFDDKRALLDPAHDNG